MITDAELNYIISRFRQVENRERDIFEGVTFKIVRQGNDIVITLNGKALDLEPCDDPRGEVQETSGDPAS